MCLIVLAVLASSAPGDPLDRDFVDRITAGLDRAVTAFAKLGRGGAYADEHSPSGPVAMTDARVHPNATPQVGHAFLLAYSTTGNDAYLRLARECAEMLLAGQLDNGGWAGEIPLDPADTARISTRLNPAAPGRECIPRPGNMDDGIAHGPIDFLFAMADVAGDARCREAARAGLWFLVNSQYPIGAWPQRWPAGAVIEGGHGLGAYPIWYTINDDLMGWNISTLLAHADELPDRVAERTVENALRWLISAQLPEPQPGWAQQYDYDMQPVAARWHEPAAVSPDATADALAVLLNAYLRTGNAEYLHPFPRALRWLRSVEGPPGLWFRYFDRAGRRIYVDERDEQTIRVYQIGESFESGYPARGLESGGKLKDFGIPHLIQAYAELQELGREKYLAKLRTPLAADEVRARAEEALAAMNPQGYWVDDNGRIRTTDFCRNVRRICAALAYPQSIGRDFTRLDYGLGDG